VDSVIARSAFALNGEFTHPSPPKPGMGSTVRRGKRLRLFSILFAVLLVGCSRDPNLRKQAYVASGNKYFDQGKYREAAIEYLNAVQIDNSYEVYGRVFGAVRTRS
jgi:hypothetical protein